MSGLQDETNFSAGGGGQFKRVLPERPDPNKVKETVAGQVADAQKAAQVVIGAAHDEFDLNGNGIDDRLEALLAEADETKATGLASAQKPVDDIQKEIADLEAQLRQKRIDFKAAKVTAKLQRGDVATAFKLAVQGAHEIAEAEFATAETVRNQKLTEAHQQVQAVVDAGGDAVKAEKDALSAYNTWLRQDTNARRIAGLKAVYQLATTIYKTAFHDANNGVELPEILVKRQNGDQPTPPQQG